MVNTSKPRFKYNPSLSCNFLMSWFHICKFMSMTVISAHKTSLFALYLAIKHLRSTDCPLSKQSHKVIPTKKQAFPYWSSLIFYMLFLPEGFTIRRTLVFSEGFSPLCDTTKHLGFDAVWNSCETTRNSRKYSSVLLPCADFFKICSMEQSVHRIAQCFGLILVGFVKLAFLICFEFSVLLIMYTFALSASLFIRNGVFQTTT